MPHIGIILKSLLLRRNLRRHLLRHLCRNLALLLIYLEQRRLCRRDLFLLVLRLNIYGKDVVISEGIEHLGREHRSFAQKNRHIVLVYIPSKNHAFPQTANRTLLQHHPAPFHGEAVEYVIETSVSDDIRLPFSLHPQNPYNRRIRLYHGSFLNATIFNR